MGQAIKCLPDLKVQGGGRVPMVLVRTDIGCSDSQIYDKDFDWDPSRKTFFLNEIEPSSTTYFVRHLKFDCIPMYGKLYADTARRYKEEKDKNAASMQDKLGNKRAVEEAEPAMAKKAKGA